METYTTALLNILNSTQLVRPRRGMVTQGGQTHKEATLLISYSGNGLGIWERNAILQGAGRKVDVWKKWDALELFKTGWDTDG